MPSEPRPEPTLSADEVHTWQEIERSLRDEPRVERTLRRARVLSDSVVTRAVLGMLVGGALVLGATMTPAALAVAGTLIVGISAGTLVSRGIISLLNRRHPRPVPWLVDAPHPSHRRH